MPNRLKEDRKVSEKTKCEMKKDNKNNNQKEVLDGAQKYIAAMKIP